MYLKHFGLNTKPFGATAEGAAVFLSPRQSDQTKVLHQGLGAQDAVVAVTGPVGVGKTTFVNKGLELIHPGRLVASVGRMRLEPEDLFALLLSGFGISRKTKGTIRQIGAFRRYLHERAATGLQVAIVVEDAQRIGIDALVELEALTAADSGATSSANLILMGQPDLHDLLGKSDLARLKQRVRQRMEVAPLTGAEMHGYLKHAVRQAGGEYDSIFDEGVADIVLGCSEGIPRLINTLCEEALGAATEDNLAKVTTELMAKIAESTFGYEVSLATPIVSAAVPSSEPESKSDIDWESPPGQSEGKSDPAIDPPAAATLASVPEIGHDIVVESGRYPEEPESSGEPIATVIDTEVRDETKNEGLKNIVSEPSLAAHDALEVTPEPEESHIPDLINDTQPELRTLAEPEDHATTLTDIEPVVVAEEAESDSGDTHTIKTLPDPGSTTMAAEPVIEDRNEDVNPANSRDDELAIDVDATNTVKALTPDLDSIAMAAAPASAAETSDSELELPTLSNSMRVEVAQEADAAAPSESTPAVTEPTPGVDGAVPHSIAAAEADSPQETDEEAALAAELEMAYALEQQEAAAAENTKETAPPIVAAADADTPQETDKEAALATELEMAYALEQQEAAAAESKEEAEPPIVSAKEPGSPAIDDENAALATELEMAYALEQQEAATAESAVNVDVEADIPEDSHTGIFDNLDPLPDLEIVQQQVNDAHANTGDVTVTDLAVSAITKKSKQDIGALEDALESAKQGASSAPPSLEPTTAADGLDRSDEVANAATGVPEITLDQSISNEQPKKAELDKFAAEIGTANSLEDFSDAMAETLFGSEAFDQIAADVVANPPGTENNPLDDMDKQSPVKLDESDMPGAANDAIEKEVTELSLEETGEQAAVEEKPVVAEKPAPKVTAPKPAAPNAVAQPHKAPRVPTLMDGGEVPLNESVAMRMEILNKMKNNVASMATENVELGESAPPPIDDSGEPKPESIEDQIDTSITQTLKAVDIARMDAEAAAEEKAEKKSGGLFSRFRKSS